MENLKMENIRITDIRKLTKLVKDLYTFDLTNYAMSSLNRRLLRFIQVYKLENMDKLIGKLETEPEFVTLFLNEITVNTTEMFRDPDMWTYLNADILPELNRRSTIRIWHSACSTGEEVASMAILLKEANLLDKARIFASDINTEVLQSAKDGSFPAQKMDFYKGNYTQFGGKNDLSHYLKPNEQNPRFVTLDKDLHKNTFFKTYDLVNGKPFGKFDLVLVRNVMIYFNKELQNDVLNLVHANMSLGGFLVLGSKETIRWNEGAKKFMEVSKEERVYRKIKD